MSYFCVWCLRWSKLEACEHCGGNGEKKQAPKRFQPYYARYAQHCFKCNQQIEQGDMVTWHRTGKRAIKHFACVARMEND